MFIASPWCVHRPVKILAKQIAGLKYGNPGQHSSAFAEAPHQAQTYPSAQLCPSPFLRHGNKEIFHDQKENGKIVWSRTCDNKAYCKIPERFALFGEACSRELKENHGA